MESPSFSRPTLSVLSGKQTATLKTSVTDEVHDLFEAFARSRGYQTSADCLQEIVLATVIGSDALADLHKRRIQSLGLNKSEAGTGLDQ